MDITARLSIAFAFVLIVITGTAAADGEADLWNEVRVCEDLNLLGRMPGVIQRLERLRARETADSMRCAQAIARLFERLSECDRAAAYLRSVMHHSNDATARQAAVDFARLAPRTGAYAEAARVLRRWTRRDERSAVVAHLALARLELDAGNAKHALEQSERARQYLSTLEGPTESFRYEAAWLEGRALEQAGMRMAAVDRYWQHFVQDNEACLRDPRIPRAIERIYRERGEVRALRDVLTAHARRAGTFSAFGTLLEYVDMMELVERGNALGLMAELEGIEPKLWSDFDGGDWHYFAAARALVARNARLARDAVISHAEQSGDFTFGVYILGLVGDDASLQRLYRLAVSATNVRKLKNITTAIARNRRVPAAERLLRRLLRAPDAAAPRGLRDAASFALASLPTDRSS